MFYNMNPLPAEVSSGFLSCAWAHFSHLGDAAFPQALQTDLLLQPKVAPPPFLKTQSQVGGVSLALISTLACPTEACLEGHCYFLLIA